MTIKKLKARITEVLDEVPDSVLTEVWNYLNEVRGKSEEQIRHAQSFRRILEEDRELLERLAK